MLKLGLFYRFIFCVGLVFLFACKSVKNYNFAITKELHSVKLLQSDVELAHQILKDGHPGLYWYISKKELDFKFDSLKNAIDKPLTTKQFYQKLAPVIAAIRCGHTTLRLPSVLNEKRGKSKELDKKVAPLSQFTYAVDGAKLIVVNNKSSQKTIKQGTEILAINNIETATILKTVSSGFSYDGYNELPKKKRIEINLPTLFSLYFDDADSIILKHKTDSIISDNTVYAILSKTKKEPRKQIDSVKISVKRDKINKKIAPIFEDKLDKFKGTKVDGTYPLDFKFLDQQKATSVLTIKSFSAKNANYSLFYKAIFDSLSTAKTQNLIIDLRNNTGGKLSASSSLFSYLIDHKFTYLAKPTITGNFNINKYKNGLRKWYYYLTGFNDKSSVYEDENGNFYAFMSAAGVQNQKENNFKGKVYLLVNELSFSASSLLAANLKGEKRAVIVGTETGGGANQCTAGIIPVVTLKNSKLALRFGLNRMAPIYQQNTFGRGVLPDIVIENTLQNRLKNYDSAMQFVLKDIATIK